MPSSEQNQRPAVEVKVRWAGDARVSEPLTYEPRHRCPSYSRGGVADPQERIRGRKRLKTGGGGEGSQTHPGIAQSSGFTACLPKAVTEGTFSRTSTA